jgi:hypothetical protein
MALFLEPRAERNFNLNSNQLAVNFVTTRATKQINKNRAMKIPAFLNASLTAKSKYGIV